MDFSCSGSTSMRYVIPVIALLGILAVVPANGQETVAPATSAASQAEEAAKQETARREAEEKAEAERREAAAKELQRRRAAVTLNYCRAALSRIRRYPSKRVLIDERERILNNLDLNAIKDAEVMSLYTAVLDEINQAQIADRERIAISEQTRRSFQRRLGTQLFVIGAQVASGQLGNAVQSGANSWWDYRTTTVERESKQWAVERTQINGIVSRSSKFLDAAWKLSQKNEIPDRWLVRTDDLVRLERTMQEPNPEVRLRVLNRMARFMECYPPYWYYVARTQQNLGQMREAARTYRRLSELGQGHFRKDDMLAAGTANLAMIEEYLGNEASTRIASEALEYSTDSWEVNLTCAWILNRHKRTTDAEDAILRNLDVALEDQQSSIALVSLYYHNGERTKLSKVLGDEKIVARIPIPGLLLCSTALTEDKFPAVAKRRIAASLSATTVTRGGTSSIAVRSTPDWKLADAKVAMQVGQQTVHQLQKPSPEALEGRLTSAAGKGEVVVVTLNYPGTPTIQLHLEPQPTLSAPGLNVGRAFGSRTSYQIRRVQVGQRQLSLAPGNRS